LREDELGPDPELLSSGDAARFLLMVFLAGVLGIKSASTLSASFIANLE
jgi:hypothetical protein